MERDQAFPATWRATGLQNVLEHSLDDQQLLPLLIHLALAEDILGYRQWKGAKQTLKRAF